MIRNQSRWGGCVNGETLGSNFSPLLIGLVSKKAWAFSDIHSICLSAVGEWTGPKIHRLGVCETKVLKCFENMCINIWISSTLHMAMSCFLLDIYILPNYITLLWLFFLKNKDSGMGSITKLSIAIKKKKRTPNTLQGKGEESQSVNMHTSWLSRAWQGAKLKHMCNEAPFISQSHLASLYFIFPRRSLPASWVPALFLDEAILPDRHLNRKSYPPAGLESLHQSGRAVPQIAACEFSEATAPLLLSLPCQKSREAGHLGTQTWLQSILTYFQAEPLRL